MTTCRATKHGLKADGMATFQSRKSKTAGMRHTVTIRNRGQKISRTFSRLDDARRWAKKTEIDIENGAFNDERAAGETNLGQALDLYLELVTSKKAASTQDREKRVANYLVAGLGKSTPLPDITAPVVAQYRDRRLQTVSAYSVRLELALLSHLYRIARREWGIVVANPVSDVDRPSSPPGRLVFLDDAQAATLLKECKAATNQMLYPYILTLLHTGMRPSEGAAQTWCQIKWDDRIIDLDKTKNGRPRRPAMTHAVRAGRRDIQGDAKAGDSIFRLSEKWLRHPIPSQWIRQHWTLAKHRAGLPSLHIHDLRHTAASHLVKKGVDPRMIADILGHTTMQMVMRYTHLFDQSRVAAVDKIGRLGMESSRARLP